MYQDISKSLRGHCIIAWHLHEKPCESRKHSKTCAGTAGAGSRDADIRICNTYEENSRDWRPTVAAGWRENLLAEQRFRGSIRHCRIMDRTPIRQWCNFYKWRRP